MVGGLRTSVPRSGHRPHHPAANPLRLCLVVVWLGFRSLCSVSVFCLVCLSRGSDFSKPFVALQGPTRFCYDISGVCFFFVWFLCRRRLSLSLSLSVLQALGKQTL